MPLSPGVRLGPYEILDAIGAGGMGEVYRAKDTRLDRTVAIKILPAHLSSDPLSKQRFEREAKTISSLNHPHICVLYDVGSQDGVDYLVMECFEGETLVKRLEKGALPLEQVLKYGMQIADALDKAHRNGVVHRDLKPGNIMLTSTGAKLLDFGLAKPTAPLSSAVTLTAATRNSPVTVQGTIVGTFQYMSPEQIEGKELDGRSDIFSLGAVLYEMVTGQRAFQGKSQLSVASAILEKEPEPISNVKPMTPPALDHAIRRALAKEVERRWQSAADLAGELQWIAEAGSQAGVPAPLVSHRKVRERLAWSVAAVLAVCLAPVAFLYLREKPPAPPAPVRFQIPPPEKSGIEYFKLSPDGRLLAFTTDRRLWIRSLDTLQALPLLGTEGASKMFWSSDSQFIAFFAQGKLKKIAVSGGPAQILCNAPEANGGTWNRDGVIVFPLSLTSGLFQVSAGGGAPVPLAKLGASAPVVQQISPEFLPDGRHFLYSGSGIQGERGIYAGSLDGTPAIRLLPDLSNAIYVPAAGAPGQDGYLLFRRGEALMAQRFNPTRLSLSGDASLIAEKVGGSVLWAAFSVSENGTLVYAPPGAGTSAVQLVWWDRAGKQVGPFAPPGTYDDFRLAPDERRIVFANSSSGNRDVWILDSVRGVTSRLTFDPAVDDPPMWSPDGLRVVWASNRSGAFDLYVKSANGTGPEELLVRMGAPAGWPEDWSRDGRFIIYEIPGTKTGQDLWIAPQPVQGESGDRKPFPYLQTEFDERHGRFSLDGRWVAYSSNESGRDEVYVQSFPVPGAKFPISAGGGMEPQWRKDGTELFYISEDRTLMAVPVKLASSASEPLQVGQAKPLFSVPVVDTFIVGRSYEVSNDGQRFLLRAPGSGETAPSLTVVLNWQTQLKE
jgi:serine/threonine protein kinase